MAWFTSRNSNGIVATAAGRNRESAPRAARSLILVVCALIGALLVWASQTELQEISRADGEITPTGELRRVDHFDGGVIRALLVATGDAVERGQVLARLDQPGLKADLREARQRRDEVASDVARVIDLLRDADAMHLPPSGTAPRMEGALVSVAAGVGYSGVQHRLFLARQAILADRIVHRNAAVQAAGQLRDNAVHRMTLSDRSLERMRALFERGVASEAQFFAQTETTETVRADQLEAELDLARSEIELREARAAREEAALAYRETHLQNLHELQKEQRLLEGRLADLEARIARLEIRSPEAGVIQSIAVSTLGEVVAPGGTVFELLPTSETLVAVIRISPKDIGHIQVGAKVHLKPSTFDTRQFGDVTGQITSISPTTVLDEREGPYFKTVVRLDSDHVGEGALRRQLRSGMIVSAEIMTSSRSVLSYLLKPINRSLEKSLSER